MLSLNLELAQIVKGAGSIPVLGCAITNAGLVNRGPTPGCLFSPSTFIAPQLPPLVTVELRSILMKFRFRIWTSFIIGGFDH